MATLSLDDKKLLKLAQLLLSKVPTTFRGVPTGHGPPQKVRAFRASKLVDFMVDPKNKSCGLDAVETQEQAIALCDRLAAFDKPRLFVRCEKIVKGGSGSGSSDLSERASGLRLIKLADPRLASSAKFDVGDDEREVRYVWIYEGDTSWNTVKLALIVLAVLALCLFQLWPPIVRVGVWYVSVTLLLALLLTTIVQLLVFSLAWLAGYEVWILPNLWSDTAMIWEIFTPPYTFAKAEGSAWYYRVALAALLAGSGYWLSQQPGELDKFMSSNRQFLDDLYAGTLLTDGSGTGEGGRGGGGGYSSPLGGSYGPGSSRYGQRRSPIPAFEDIDRMLRDEEDEKEEAPRPEGGDGAGEAPTQEKAVEEDGSAAAAAEPDMDAMMAADEEASREHEGEGGARGEGEL